MTNPPADPAAAQGTDEPTQRWFAGKDVDTLIYRINRRAPAGGPIFFSPPPSVLTHLEQVLSASTTYETGRQPRRQWHIGNKVFNHTDGTLTGRVGWTRETQVNTPEWDEARQEWADRYVTGDTTIIAPFAFIADGRYLGVLHSSTFTEKSIAAVFRQILNRGENRRAEPSTEWDVEPIGDEREFYDWVAATDRVLGVEFVFKRPNPDAEREFEQLFARMDELEARQIRELIAAQNEARGLNKEALRHEPVTRMFVTAAMAAFGYVVGKGITRGRRTQYDQRSRVARERIENVAPSWEGATEEVLDAVLSARARRRPDG